MMALHRMMTVMSEQTASPFIEPLAFDVATASDALGIGRTTLYGEIDSGRLRSIKVGRRRLITRAALEQWIADRSEESQ